MLGLKKPKSVAEHEAEGETERVYHEIKQTLRVSGVNLNFRTWAIYEKFLPAMWDALRPNLETRAFEDASDRIRAEAVRHAAALGRATPGSVVHLGESQKYQIRAALDLYHYINPKLLVLTAAVRLALDGEQVGGGQDTAELIERGVPARMYPMEMVAEEPDDERVRDVFEDIKKTLSLRSINSDYRTLALWPGYLTAAWNELKPIIGRDECRTAGDTLREAGRSYARSLPFPVRLSRINVEQLGEDAGEIVETTRSFERLLPPLILNIALLGLEWRAVAGLERSPFPAAQRGKVKVRRGDTI